jgi:hypothetical protein
MFVDIGGFVIQGTGHNTTLSPNGPKVLPVETSQPSDGAQVTSCYHLTSFKLHMLRKNGILTRLPNIGKEELNAISKSDAFSKTIAVVQITWLLFQVLVRTARGLAISQLELAVSAFSICGILTYFLSWSKPKDCQVPIVIMQYPDGIPDDLLQKLSDFHEIENHSISTRSVVPLVFGFDNRPRHGSNTRNDISWNSSPPGTQPHFSTVHVANVVGICLGSAVFGIYISWLGTSTSRLRMRERSGVPPLWSAHAFRWCSLAWPRFRSGLYLRKLFQWFRLFFGLRFDMTIN